MSKKYRFRSGAEKTMAECLTAADVPFDFEPHYVPYVWLETKKYLPDFVLESWCKKNNFLYCDLKDGVPQKWLDA